MRSSRREFLKRGTLMALAAGVPLACAEKAFGTVISTSDGPTLASFKSQLGTTFLINRGKVKIRTTLININSFASRKQTAAGKEGFSLLFRGTAGLSLDQDTYLVEHEQLGTFSFLIVPVGTRDMRTPHYEAVINRLHS